MPDDFRIITRGQGPDLVLLHGWGMHSGIWGRIADVLATEFRVNLVDLPGHGVNARIPLSRNLNDVAGSIMAELPSAIWVGWSLGGLVTLAAALEQPEKVQKMVMVAATPSFSKRPDWDCGADKQSQQDFSDGLENDFAGTLNQFCLKTFGASWLEDSLHRLGVSSIIDNVPSKQVLHTGLYLLYHNNLLTRIRSCKVPSLFLGGSRDRTVRPGSLSQAAALMPAASAVVIPGAGHAPFISHEEKFLDITLGFLNARQGVAKV